MNQPLPPIPARIRKLPIDHRGFPVPWFVQWMEDGEPTVAGQGKPDFRVLDALKFKKALLHARCWICGEQLGQFRVFIIGPMCSINRITSEPPSHRECAEFAVKACPFLVRPRMRRNDVDLPAGDIAGFHLDHNPGASCLWQTSDYRPFRVKQGSDGFLIRLGDPQRVDWYAEGKLASHQQVMDAINKGLPSLYALCDKDRDRDGAIRELNRLRDIALKLIPVAA